MTLKPAFLLGRENMKHKPRYGKVTVSHKLIDEDPLIVANVIFKDCVILRAESCYIENAINYTIYSPDLDIVDFGMVKPTYTAELSEERDDAGEVVNVTRKWKKENV